MRRFAPIVVCFVLALLSLPSLPAPVAAQQTLPQRFLGTWEGDGYTARTGFRSPVSIELTGGSIGAVVGTIYYPAQGDRPYECSATLRLQSVGADELQVTLLEETAGCPWDANAFTLTNQNDGSLRYEWTHQDQNRFPGTFAATLRPTARCSWTGTWWSSVYGYLRLTQRGSTVSGDYDWDQGQMSGTVIGDTLAGTWTEVPSPPPDPADTGEFVFTIAADCQSFTGQWRYGSAGEWFTDWSATRVVN